MIINDWKPEVRSLLKSLIAAGFEILRGNNGASSLHFGFDRAVFVNHLIACDEASLYVRKDGKTFWLYLVLGNEPGVIVSDYTVSDDLDKVTDSHYEKWSNRKQPTCESPY
jgi:hypothetical protein